MKIGIIGTGAVGGYFGAKLFKTGFEIVFIGTKKSTETIKETGFFIKSPDGDIEIKEPNISSSYKSIEDCDLILVCTKAYNTKEIAEGIKDFLGSKAIVLSLQNGVENEEILSSVLGKEKIIPASIYLSAAAEKPGLINHAGSGRIILGEFSKEETERIKKIKEIFDKANIPTKISPNLFHDMWKKLIVNSAYNGMTAVIGTPLTKINEVTEAKQLYFDILKEGQNVAKAEGIEISDSEVEKLFSMLEQPVFINFKSSTLQDFEKRKPLEIDAIQGSLIKIGQKHNIKTPLNKTIYALLKLKEASFEQSK